METPKPVENFLDLFLARSAARLTQAECAAIVGVTPTMWNFWENGIRPFPEWALERFNARVEETANRKASDTKRTPFWNKRLAPREYAASRQQEKLRCYRGFVRLNQTEVSAALKISHMTWSRWERGERRMPKAHFDNFFEKFHIPVELEQVMPADVEIAAPVDFPVDFMKAYKIKEGAEEYHLLWCGRYTGGGVKNVGNGVSAWVADCASPADVWHGVCTQPHAVLTKNANH